MAPIKVGGVSGNKREHRTLTGSLEQQMNSRPIPFNQQPIVCLRAFPQKLMGEQTFAGIDFPL